jgi:hypothetical protein
MLVPLVRRRGGCESMTNSQRVLLGREHPARALKQRHRSKLPRLARRQIADRVGALVWTGRPADFKFQKGRVWLGRPTLLDFRT